MQRPSERAGRHRKPEPVPTKPRKLGRVIVWNTIFVLALGAIFVGGYLLVWQLIADDKPALLQSAPASPAMPISAVNIDKDCSDFFDHDDAQKYYIAQGGPASDPDHLDLDNDGLACENYDYSKTDRPVPPSTAGVQNPKFRTPNTSEVNAK